MYNVLTMKSFKEKMCCLIQEVHRACYVNFSGATVFTGECSYSPRVKNATSKLVTGERVRITFVRTVKKTEPKHLEINQNDITK